MTPSETPAPLKRLVLATDLASDAPEVFAQALGLALRLRAELYLVHVADAATPAASWATLPTVREVLERWGRLRPGASYDEFEQLGVRVHAIEQRPTDGDVTAAVIRRVSALHPDLLLLGTHQRTGLAQLLRGSVAEAVSRATVRSTLFLPTPVRPLVLPETGAVALRRVLVPIAAGAELAPAFFVQLDRLASHLTDGHVQFVLLHVGTFDSIPEVPLPDRPRWSWKADVRRGDPVTQILEAEVAHEVDLVAMATRGHDALLDDLLGSVTERVVRRTRCPVFAVPI
jgi:nucleotide-binding universal stress UspA family protein